MFPAVAHLGASWRLEGKSIVLATLRRAGVLTGVRAKFLGNQTRSEVAFQCRIVIVLFQRNIKSLIRWSGYLGSKMQQAG
jgi:hypothetical protein